MYRRKTSLELRDHFSVIWVRGLSLRLDWKAGVQKDRTQALLVSMVAGPRRQAPWQWWSYHMVTIRESEKNECWADVG